ncbi:MAG: S8 family serine peptidase [Proteobacteria bacterium]|nr:S8 family serine peptidase [Pseudomonadota bacterium]
MKKSFLYITLATITGLLFSCSFNSKSADNSIPKIIFSKPAIKSKKNIIVAVIDTGIDVNHRELKGSLWTAKDGKKNGWNFVDNNNNVNDDIGHGTHIAGIIKSSNANITLMILKYYDSRSDSQKNAFENSLKAIRFAIDNRADIINYSGGGRGSSSQELALLKEAESKGIIVVTAAGNESSDIDTTPYYPASYRLSNIISVAFLDGKGKLAKESNYGASTVDVAAPGEDIYSTLPGNKHGYLTGTSQATAYVTAMVASIKSANPKLNYKEIKKLVLASSYKNNNLIGKVVSPKTIIASTIKNIYIAKAQLANN